MWLGTKGFYQWRSEINRKIKERILSEVQLEKREFALPRREFLRGLNRILPKPAFLFDRFLWVFLSDETRNTIYGGEGSFRFLGFRFFLPFPCPRECLFTRPSHAQPGVGQAHTRNGVLVSVWGLPNSDNDCQPSLSGSVWKIFHPLFPLLCTVHVINV